MDKRFLKKTWVTEIIFCVVIPVLNSFLLQLLYSYFISGDYRFQSIDPLASNLIDFIRTVAMYCGYAIMIYMMFVSSKKDAKKYIVMRAATFPIPYLSAAAVVFITVTNAISVTGYMLLYTLIQLSVDYVIFAVIMLFVSRIIKRTASSADVNISLSKGISPKKNPLLRSYMLVCAVFAIVSFVTDGYNTAELLIQYGKPLNSSEWWTLISPYVETIVYFLAGYTVMLMTANKAEGDYLKHVKNK